MATVTVEINGRPYAVGCADGQEDRVRLLAKQFDGHVRQVAGEVGHVGDIRLFLMAGLLLADELHEARLNGGKAGPSTLAPAPASTDGVAEALNAVADTVTRCEGPRGHCADPARNPALARAALAARACGASAWKPHSATRPPMAGLNSSSERAASACASRSIAASSGVTAAPSPRASAALSRDSSLGCQAWRLRWSASKRASTGATAWRAWVSGAP